MDENTANAGAATAEGERSVTVVMHPCRRQWAELQATDQPDVRFCFDCCQTVVHVRTTEGVMQAAAAGECVFVEATEDHNFFLGSVVIPELLRKGPLTWED